jgi:nucleoside 2-deoxyribosyltransferase
MSKGQKAQFKNVLLWIGASLDEFHHGAAAGADEQAANAVSVAKQTWPNLLAQAEIIPHPAGSDPLARNREIVDSIDILIAAPLKDDEELRSGTWATVRYARAAGKPVVMLSRGRT